jgi:ABC-type sugar transport system ATPase subunit
LVWLAGGAGHKCSTPFFEVEQPTAGRIQVEGRRQITSYQQASELGLAYVPEDRQLHGYSAMHINRISACPCSYHAPDGLAAG